MDTGSPDIGVDFVINFGDSFGGLKTLDDLIGTTSANAVREFQRLQAQVSNGLGLDEAAAKFRTLDAASTRAMRSAAQEAAQVERAGESLIRSLEKQNSTFGKSRVEVRAMKVEEAALAAERTKNTDLAVRLRSELALLVTAEAEAATAAASHAARLREEATAADLTMRQHTQLAAAVRGSHDAQVADAAAADRLRAATDPLYAATSRLNAEIAESTRLYYAGATAPAEYARQQEVLTGRLHKLTVEQDAHAASARRSSGTMTQLSFQLNDVATMAAMGAPPFQIFASQIGQIVQVAQQAEGGMKGFGREVGGMALRFAPLLAVTALAGVAISRWMADINKGADMKAYADTLGLTAKETEKLKGVTVTTGDFVAGAWKTLNDGLGLTAKGKKLVDYLFGPNDAQQVAGFVAEIYGFFVGGYKGIVEVWSLLPAAIGDVVSRSAKATVVAIEAMINGAIDRVNALAKGANALAGVDLFGTIDKVKLDTPAIDAAVAAYAGAGKKAGEAFGRNVEAERKKALSWMKGVAADIGANSVAAAEARLRKQRDEIVKDRTPKKPKVDHAGESLARDIEATEAQIRNLNALAKAYGISGAAALIAEARVKAESQAIKQQNGALDAAIDRQVRLAIAQRVSDAAKSTAAVRDQAIAQEAVNRQVAAGLVPAERAAELTRNQIADLPLVAALKAAQTLKSVEGIEAVKQAAKALDEQRAARGRLTAAEQQAQFDVAMATGGDRLAELKEELRLVGATDMARMRALATLRATQEAEKFNPADRAAYIKQQVDIAVGQQTLAEKQDAFNASLTATADLFDTIDQSAQRAASGMADAFGNAGAAIGDVLTIVTGYYADQARLQQAHKAAIDAAAGDQTRIAREQQQYAIRSSSLQIGAFGDMASAAKGFFKEGSTGYKAMAAAEKVYRVAQLAMSIQAMVQNAAETLGFVTNSAAKSVAAGTEGIANQSKLPFPFNIAAMAATGAALVAAGIAVVGGMGGGGGSSAPKTNVGAGTVLGDPAAQSESLKRSIDALREVDTTTSVFARQMAGSLRSIDDQIGGLAAVLVRSGNVDASAGVTEGFKKDAIGSVLSKLPLVGGILGGLFGSKTTVTGSGLFGSAQSVGDILAGGFDASTYSDVQKKKKLFGITTSTKTSTQFAAADAGLENQFTLILRSFATAIGSAAAPLGEATDAVQARLSGFVVNIGKIDLKGLTGSEIQEKLEAVFGAAADGMADAALPGVARFQKAGEGAFETLVRVASTLEAVSTSLDLLGTSARAMSMDAKLGLADQFGSVGDLTSAVDAYFTTYYTKAEQSAAKAAQLGRVFGSLGLAMPATLDGFRQLVEAQDLTTVAGQSTYATLLQLAPAFADLQEALGATKSAADIAAERQDLERKLMELRGDTVAIRAAELAKLDASNRGLQEQIYAIQEAQEAAKAADELRKAWSSVGDSIMDEVKRIRGLSDVNGGNSFAALMGQFNAANSAARAGDMDAAKGLPALSQALLAAAADAATSRQELARVQAATAAQLEATYGVVGALAAAKPTSTAAQVTAAAESQGGSPASAAKDDTAVAVRELRDENVAMRRDLTMALATIASNTGKSARVLDMAQQVSGGPELAVAVYTGG